MFTQVFTGVALSEGALIAVFGVFDCLRLCTDTLDCSSFFHSEEKGLCQLSSTRYESAKVLKGVGGYNYYMMRPDCPSSWYVVEDQCYHLFTKANTASVAQASCVKLGGFLAKIDSDSDRDVIRQKLAQTSDGKNVEKILQRKKREIAKKASNTEIAEAPTETLIRQKEAETPSIEIPAQTSAGNMVAGTAVWLGGTDAKVEGNWVWRDGTVVSVDGWKSGEPDNSTVGDDCMQQTADGFWIDVDCSTLLSYLCEM